MTTKIDKLKTTKVPLLLLTESGGELGRIQGYEAGAEAAQRWANERGEAVELASTNGGSEWFAPAVDD